jgi:hypothetical protein
MKQYQDTKKINGIYLAVDYHPNTDFILNKFAKELGLQDKDIHNGNTDLDPSKEYKFHTTIIYSKFKNGLHKDENDKSLVNFLTKNGSSIFQKKRPKLSVPIKIKGVGFFDIKNEKTNKNEINFHIKVGSPFLTSEFNRAIKFGLPTDFPKYDPHITISNNVSIEFRKSIEDSSHPDYKKNKNIISKYVNATLYSNDEYIEQLD